MAKIVGILFTAPLLTARGRLRGGSLRIVVAIVGRDLSGGAMKTVTVSLTDKAFNKLSGYVTTKQLISSGHGVDPDTLVSIKIIEAIRSGEQEVEIRSREDV